MNTQEKEVENRIKAIKRLEKEVADLKHYVFVINPLKQVKRGIGNDIIQVLKIETTKRFSIASSRWIGMGHQESEIEIPDTLLEKYYSLALEQLQSTEQELESLVLRKEIVTS